ncbi:MAG TPA: AAA family ATPase [Paludibacter sp.]|nr:AAA family ATPase [Paludibacter sp.]
MGILLSKVRIRNYRSIESLSLELGPSNILVGQNNTGKTNFLKALNLAVSGITDISEDDIFVGHCERLTPAKTATIDIMLQPADECGKVFMEFSEFWNSVFTDSWISTSADGNFVGIRTEIKYDTIKESYGLSRRCIRQWKDSIADATVEPKATYFNEDMRTYLQSFYMDANRDIVQDLRNRKSYFGRVTSNYDLDQEIIDEIEEHLNAANVKIIGSIPSLQQTKEHIAVIGQTIGSRSSKVEIEPLARKLSDLNKGMDIIMQDSNAASFPISQHGHGTRSWISFLTLSAFVDNQNQKLKEGECEQFILLTMEEPEAHLHPQAQRRLFEQISSFQGQKVISTHSPSIVAQSTLTHTIYFSKREGKTMAIRYKSDDSQRDAGSLFRQVINTRADLLFASAVILCEGITEESALPIYFTKYFGCAPYSLGVSIIKVDGKYNYKPFLSLLAHFDIPWFILSDGETETINAVNSALKQVFTKDDHTTYDNIFFIDNGDDYEKHLIRSGYSEIMIKAICEYEGNDNFFDNYISSMDGQNRNKNVVRNYNHPEGRTEALIDVCHEHKTDYAIPIARRISEQENGEKRFPPIIKTLLSALANEIGAEKASFIEDKK